VPLCSYALNSHFPEQISLKNMHTKRKDIETQDTNLRIFTPLTSKYEKETTSMYEVYRSQSSSVKKTHHLRD